MWFRRDLRLGDNPALLESIAAARSTADDRVVPLFVIDPVLWTASVRSSYLRRSLAALDRQLDGALLVLAGPPESVLPRVAQLAFATSVHIAADHGPYGRRRDERVQAALGAVPLVRTGSSYAVAPGRVRKSDGDAYLVFTPFSRAWADHGWRAPAGAVPDNANWWRPITGDDLPSTELEPGALPAGERAARERWHEFVTDDLDEYADRRDRPDLAGTSRLSHHLKFGELHPRTLLADLSARGAVGDPFRRQLCWREFYADRLFHRPDSGRQSLDRRFDDLMPWASDADAAFAAWRTGLTGYPIVDAGMRQLRTEGWIHNRVRMVVASFLVKDLHLPWQLGAAEFMRWLRDGDLASNSHGWQWVAGCGTDAAPFHRVFNPVRQGLTFDPDGDFVRRYIPELRHVGGASVHEPWLVPDGYAHGYPERSVDHSVERLAALADYAAIRHDRKRSAVDQST